MVAADMHYIIHHHDGTTIHVKPHLHPLARPPTHTITPLHAHPPTPSPPHTDVVASYTCTCVIAHTLPANTRCWRTNTLCAHTSMLGWDTRIIRYKEKERNKESDDLKKTMIYVAPIHIVSHHTHCVKSYTPPIHMSSEQW